MSRRAFRAWSFHERMEAVRLYREECLSMAEIGRRLGRNVSSVGYQIRRQDAIEERAERREDERRGHVAKR